MVHDPVLSLFAHGIDFSFKTISYMDKLLVLLLFLTFSVLVANPEKLLYTGLIPLVIC